MVNSTKVAVYNMGIKMIPYFSETMKRRFKLRILEIDLRANKIIIIESSVNNKDYI